MLVCSGESGVETSGEIFWQRNVSSDTDSNLTLFLLFFWNAVNQIDETDCNESWDIFIWKPGVRFNQLYQWMQSHSSNWIQNSRGNMLL